MREIEQTTSSVFDSLARAGREESCSLSTCTFLTAGYGGVEK